MSLQIDLLGPRPGQGLTRVLGDLDAGAVVAAVTAVPEPGTWAMMLLGFLAVGAALRSAPRRALLPA